MTFFSVLLLQRFFQALSGDGEHHARHNAQSRRRAQYAYPRVKQRFPVNHPAIPFPWTSKARFDQYHTVIVLGAVLEHFFPNSLYGMFR